MRTGIATRIVAAAAAFVLLTVGASRLQAQNRGEAEASAPSAAITPPPTAAAPAAPGENVLLSIAFSQSAVESVLSKLSEKTGKNIVARGKTLGQKVTLILKNQPLEFALDQICNGKPNWLWVKGDAPNTYEVWDQESFRAEVLPKRVRQKVFLPREITAEEAYKAVQGVLTPNIGTASFDARSNKVIVTDQPEVLELVQRLIEQIDVKFVTRVFYIAHADVQSIVDKLNNLKSAAAPAIDFDVRTHLVIVRDRLEIIRQMELLVETLDVGPEIRVYELNNLGFEGADKAELEEAIQQVLTPDAYYKINTQSAKLLVEDIPEVHEKIEKILKAFDQPPKQVLIQAEIIETNFNEGLQYGTEWTVSGDLFSSVIDGLTGGGASTGTGAATVSAGSVPIGKQPVTPETLGFLDFRKEFPIVQGGGEGLNAQYLSRHAYIQLKAAMQDKHTRLLQQPRVLTMNQKEVSFSIGQSVPFYSGGSVYNNQPNNNNNNGYYNSGPQQQTIDTGLDLLIRPVILANGLVQMEVELTNSVPDKSTVVYAGQLYSAVGKISREIATTLIIPTGETRVIGGLVFDTKNETRSGIPYLVKIPVVGPLLFGKYDKPSDDTNARRNLLIFLTPTVVEEKLGDLRRYKGRIIMDEAAAAEDVTTPSATLTDMHLEPLPVEVPGKGLLPPPPDETGREPGSARDGRGGRAGAALLEPPAEPPVPMETPVPEPTPDATGMVDLRRMNIGDISTTGPNAVTPRGPSGALTGTGSTSPQPPAASSSPGSAVPGRGRTAPAATPGVFRPAGGPRTGIGTSSFTPPPVTETRF